MRKHWCIGIALLSVVMGLQAASANLLVDPSFEEGELKWVTQDYVNANTWAARTGTNGLVFPGWEPTVGGSGTIQQDVAATNLGEYTFSVYVNLEPGFNLNNIFISLQWKDANSNDCQSASTVTYTSFPQDQYWHQLRVSGVATAAAMQHVRVVIKGTWNAFVSGDSACRIDDAALYEGPFVRVNALVNNSFEMGQSDSWDGSAWAGGLTKNFGGPRGWVRRTGDRAVSLFGWDNGQQGTFASQPLSPATGTYTFAFWTRRESTNFYWTNIQARIEWYDSTLTNKVMADSVTNIPAPSDLDWHQYYVTATCSDSNLFEARPMAGLQWLQNPNVVDARTAAIDDARWLTGEFIATPIGTDWHYFSGMDDEPVFEQVPGTNVGTFLQVNYAVTSTTFFALIDPAAALYPQENLRAGLRTSYPADGGGYQTDYRDMTYIGDVTLDNGNPFHGLPLVGTKTLQLWKYVWTQPTNGYPAGNFIVYYTPYVRSLYGNGIQETAIRYLLNRDGEFTNNYPIHPQILGSVPDNRDYSYFNRTPVPTAFTNGGFENPVETTNLFDNTGWFKEGDFGRETWAANEGKRGAYLSGWDTIGYKAGWLYQDLPVTSRTNTFTAYFNMEPSFNATNVELRLDWYDSNYKIIQRDTRNVMHLPLDSAWHPAYLTGVCNSSDVLFVRACLYAKSYPKIGTDNASLRIDNVNVYDGEYQLLENLVNGSFEAGLSDNEWRGTSWATAPEMAGFDKGGQRIWWAARSGNSGFALASDSADTNAYGARTTLLTQSLTPGTGTYTFSIWLNQEMRSLVTNIVMQIDGYDSGRVLLQSTNYSVPLPLAAWRTWYRFDLTGTMDDEDMFEVTASVLFNWSITNQQGEQAFRVDDAQFMRGSSYPTNFLNLDWNYYNAGSISPTNEAVPGSAVGAFMQVNYATTTTTFYVLSATNCAILPGETSAIGLHIYEAFYGNEQFVYMTKVGPVVLQEASPFHGLPGSGDGDKTLDLWKYEWRQPLTNDAPVTNGFMVYYVPYVDSLHDGVILTDRKYFNRPSSGGTFTNNYTIDPQAFSVNYLDKDYSYWNVYSVGGSTDGIPNEWWERYGIVGGDRVATNDPDTDDYNNFEEWVADSVPTNSASFYPNYVTNMTGRLTMILRMGPPTTNSRLYQVYWMTNLMNQGDGWTPYGVSVPGDDAGGAVSVTVTNDGVQRFYRTGVALP